MLVASAGNFIYMQTERKLQLQRWVITFFLITGLMFSESSVSDIDKKDFILV